MTPQQEALVRALPFAAWNFDPSPFQDDLRESLLKDAKKMPRFHQDDTRIHTSADRAKMAEAQRKRGDAAYLKYRDKVLSLWNQGKSKKGIAKILGINDTTVAKYIRRAELELSSV